MPASEEIIVAMLNDVAFLLGREDFRDWRASDVTREALVASVKRALSDLEKRAVRLEILGSYPRSEPLD